MPSAGYPVWSTMQFSQTKEGLQAAKLAYDCAEFSGGVVVIKPFMTQSHEISAVLHAFVRALIWCINIIHLMNSELQCSFSVASHRDQPSGAHCSYDNWTISLSSDWQGGGEARGMQRLNLVPNQWALSGSYSMPMITQSIHEITRLASN